MTTRFPSLVPTSSVLHRSFALAAFVAIFALTASPSFATGDEGRPGAAAAPTAARGGPWFVDAVNGNDSNSGLAAGAGNAFATINHAISVAASGDTINVASGTYSEHVAVNKTLTILGANAGVDPRANCNAGPARGLESIVRGAPNGPKQTTAFTITADDATIDGFTIQDQTDTNVFGAGIYIGSGVEGTTLRYCIVQNNMVGMFLANNNLGNPAKVNHNRFANNNNLGPASGAGIYFDQYTASGPVLGALIDQNEFVGHADAGIDSSTQSASIFNQQITISNNTFDANARALVLFNVTSSNVTRNHLKNASSAATADIRLFEGNSALSITENLMENGAGYAVRVGQFGTPLSSNITFTGNSVTGYGSNNVDIQAGAYVGAFDASGNWWGSNVAGAITAKLSGTVDYTPWLDVGTDLDANACNGFQGDFSTLHVDDDSPQAGAVTRIQEGVNVLADGSLTGGARVVDVKAGTYAENVTVNKSATLAGPNFGNDPCTTSRVAEAVVLPAVVETSLQASTSGMLFRIGSGSGHVDVTIDGFWLDGHNPALSGGRVLNGVEVHTGAGIANSLGSFDANPAAFNTTMIVRNNVIQNLERYGVLVDNIPTVVPNAGNVVSHNKIDNLPSGNNFGGDRGRAVAFEENAYGTCAYNCISRVNVGWQDDNYWQPSPGAGTVVDHNTIRTYHRGIFHNLQYAGATDATISNNDIYVETSGAFPASSTNFGLELASIQSAVGCTVVNNNSTGNVNGILLWNLPTTTTITVSGGTLTGNTYGVRATSFDDQFSAGSPSVTSVVSGVTVSGSSVAGVYVDDSTSTRLFNLKLTGNSSISGCANGVLVKGPGAKSTIINNAMSITTNTIGIVVDGGTALIENNNLTGNTGAGIQAKNGALVDAGDCAGNNVTGLGTGTGINGSSAGLNNLTGYGVDNVAPWAVEDLNSNVQPNVFAENNNFGLVGAQNAEDLFYDDTDNAAKSKVFGGQQSTLTISCPPTGVPVECSSTPPGVPQTLASFLALGGTASTTTGTATYADSGLIGGPCNGHFDRVWTVTDACGHSATCTQTFPAHDTIPPTINSCGANPPNVAVGPNCQGAVPDVTGNVVASDLCGPVASITQSPPAGTLAPLGPNTITITVKDGCNNMSTCQKTVTMVDLIPPTITCTTPSGTANLDATCHAVVPNFIPTVIVGDNCPLPPNAVTQSPAAGTVLNAPTLGVPIVVVMTVTDGSNNHTSCNINLNVIDVTPPTINCLLAGTKVILNGSCQALVPDLSGFVTANDNCGTVLVTQNPAAGSTVSGIGTITVVMTATDPSGLTAMCSIALDKVDNLAPVINCAGMATHYECASDVPALPADLASFLAQGGTATDNCGPLSFSSQTISDTGGTGCPTARTIVRKFTVSDAALPTPHTVTCNQTINVHDTIAPVISPAPGPVTVQCQAQIPALATLPATDNCSGALVATPTDGPPAGSFPCNYSFVRSWNVSDACANAATAVTQLITVHDNTAPVIDPAPAAVTVQCTADVPVAGTLPATDNCAGALVATATDGNPQGSFPCNYTILRTWAVSDPCGNPATPVTQLITVHDTTAPVISAPPAPVTVQCAAQIPPLTTLSASDNCAGTLTATATDDGAVGSVPCNYTITRRWHVSDPCGNPAIEVTQLITVQDTMPPVIDPAPAPVTVQCASQIPPLVTLSASDNCAGTLTATATDDAPVGSEPCNYTITRRWHVSDVCNNPAIEVTQLITVHDTTAPVIDPAPAPVTVQCTADIPVAGTLSATDNCGGMLTATATDGAAVGDYPCNYTILRSWNVSDACTNAATPVTQLITVHDTMAPVIATASGSLDRTVECSDAVALGVALGLAPTATDNCSAATIHLTGDNTVTTSCPGSYTRTRTWNFTDACTNTSATFTQTITVQDNVGPTFQNFPANANLNCDQPRDPWATGAPTATDACGTATVTYDDVRTGLNLCNSTGQIVRTWKATDQCGHVTTQDQIIAVHDSIPPVLVTPCPSDISVNNTPGLCSATVGFTPPTAVDVCYDQGFEAAGWVADADGDLSRSTDWNYSYSSVVQVPTMTDGIPSASGGSHAVITSTGLMNYPTNGSSYLDNYTGAFTRLGGYNTSFGTGFRASLDVYLNVADPRVTGASDTAGYGWDLSTAVTKQSGLADHLRDFIFHAAAYDQMTTPGIVIGASNNSSDYTRRNDLLTVPHAIITASGWYTFEWIFRDDGSGALACDMRVRQGNAVPAFSQTLGTPADLISTIVGGNRYMWFTFLQVDKLAIDNTHLERNVAMTCTQASGSSFPVGTTPVTCSGADACGNPVSCSFNVVVTDVDPPAITCPTAIPVECSAPIPAPATNLGEFQMLGGAATDNCGVASVVWVEDDGAPPLSGCGAYDITRTYKVTDIHGLMATCTQTIHVVDTTAPQLTTSAGALDATLECSDTIGLNAALALVPAATDNCTAVPTLHLLGDVSTPGSCVGRYVRVRTWDFTDACNNHSLVFTQTITVVDTTGPVVTTLAGSLDATLECSNLAGIAAALAAAPSATDNCTAVPSIHLLSDDPMAGPCAGTFTRVRTWNFTDACGNPSATFTQTIMAIDTTAPVVTTAPGSLDVTLQCSDVAGLAAALAAGPSATDNCTPMPTRNLLSDTPNPGSCLGQSTRVRTWDFTDGCDHHSATFTQVITFIDTTPPSITTGVGALNATLECSDVVGLAAALAAVPSATDLCSSATIHPTGDSTAPGSCPSNYVRTRTWNFTDACMNTSATFTQVITVHDLTPPVANASGTLATWYATQADAGSAAELLTSATDNCTGTPTRHLTFTSGPGCALTIHVNFTDDCMNVSTPDLVFTTVIDNAAPVISGCPANQTYNAAPGECSHMFTWTPPTANDACAGSITPVEANGHVPGEVFLAGTTTITYTATDPCGHVSTCSFTLTVNADFGGVSCYSTGAAPAELDVADLGSGIGGSPTIPAPASGLDVVTADSAGDSLTVRFNNGTGNFNVAPAMTIALSSGDTPTAVVAGHFLTGSAGLDLAVACRGRVSPPVPSSVKFFKNNGGGWVFDHTCLLGGTTEPVALSRGQFDGNALEDLAVACTGTFIPLANGGTGIILNGGSIYTALSTTTPPRATQDVAVGDLDGDGLLDIAAVESVGGPIGTNRLKLFYANGPASFDPPVNMQTVGDPYAVAVGDLDGNGAKNDIVVASDDGVLGAPAQLETWANQNIGGQGALAFFAPTITSLVGSNAGPSDDGIRPRDVAVGDLQLDTLLKPPAPNDAYFCAQDVVTANFDNTGSSISVADEFHCTNPAIRTFTRVSNSCRVANIASAVALADVTGDHLPDIIVTDFTGNKFCVVESRVRALATPFGMGCPGSNGTPVLTGNNLAIMGQIATVDLASARPSSVVVLGVSASIFENHLLPSPCIVYLANPIFTFPGLVSDGGGNLHFSFAVPNVPSPFLGAEVYFQAAVADPFGSYANTLALSNALRVRLGF